MFDSPNRHLSTLNAKKRKFCLTYKLLFSVFAAPNITGSDHLYNTLELLMMGIVLPETCWACNKICNKYHLLHLVGILFMCPVCRLLKQQPANRTHNLQLHTILTTWKPKHQIPHAATICIILSSSWRWA